MTCSSVTLSTLLMYYIIIGAVYLKLGISRFSRKHVLNLWMVCVMARKKFVRLEIFRAATIAL